MRDYDWPSVWCVLATMERPCLLKMNKVTHKAKDLKKMNWATPAMTPATPANTRAPDISAITKNMSA